jgi:hypothetical protein
MFELNTQEEQNFSQHRYFKLFGDDYIIEEQLPNE